MSPQTPLPLRDVHPGLAPPWWPPAPGWWWLLGGTLLVLLVLAAWRGWRARKERHWRAYFEQTLRQAPTAAAQVAEISALLRRAARRIDPQADRLQGEDWLRLLDSGWKVPAFAAGPGELLLEGMYRREIDPAALEALRSLARRRFVQWMTAT
ncbi:DUF4381 family protein [Thermomonas alba]|uniref:DUF4381 family protein n=1 Tax=Thermomonas alba TaxID=2888525 RepID=UPI001F04DB10|nr:DUF4381 family protein [Thermomonas alba]